MHLFSFLFRIFADNRLQTICMKCTRTRTSTAMARWQSENEITLSNSKGLTAS